MQIHTVKADPCGNTTLFVRDPIPRADMANLGAQLLTASGVEQVAFLEPPTTSEAVARMQMAGGEFCGNATRSFGAWLAMGGPDGPLRGLTGCTRVPVEVSGWHGVLTVEVSGQGEPGVAAAAVDMPLPSGVIAGRSPDLGDYSLVPFDGIVHLVLWGRGPDEAAAAAGLELVHEAGFPDDCVGVMFMDVDRAFMTPVVSVKAVGSLIWESSCGSGTVAAAFALARRQGRDVSGYTLHQPGGMLCVDADMALSHARINGAVNIDEPTIIHLA